MIDLPVPFRISKFYGLVYIFTLQYLAPLIHRPVPLFRYPGEQLNHAGTEREVLAGKPFYLILIGPVEENIP